MFEPELLYFVTNRTIQGRLLMTPTKETTLLIGGVIAKAMQLYKVELFNAVFLSNHYHMIIKAAEGELSAFVGYVQGNIAREIGRLVDWHGHFWNRRFAAEAILDDEALIEKMGYIFAHGVKEGLVEHSHDWPGLNLVPQLRLGVRRLFKWVDRTTMYRRRQKGRPCKESDVVEYISFEVSPIPCWAELSAEEQRKKIRKLINEVERQAREKRGSKAVVGASEVRSQDPHNKPKELTRTPRPLCHATVKSLYKEYREKYRAFVNAYRIASAQFRAGNFKVIFPTYAFRPPLPYRVVAIA